MKKIKILIGIIIFVGSILIVNYLFYKPFKVNNFCNRTMIYTLLDDPELLSILNFPIISENRKSKLNNYSIEEIEKREKKYDRYFRILRSYNKERFSEEELINYQIFEWYLTDLIEQNKWSNHIYYVNHIITGVQNFLPTFLITSHTIQNKNDAKSYIKRLANVKETFNGLLKRLELNKSKGYLPPRFVFDHVITSMNRFISDTSTKNILYTSFEEKIANVESIKNKEKYLVQVDEQIRESVYPAYEQLITFFKENYNLSTSDDGVWKLPDGDNYYKHALKRHTTTEMSPEEVHQLGLKEVDRIIDEFYKALNELGYTDRSVTIAEHLKSITKEKEFYYENADADRDKCMEDYNQFLNESYSKLVKFFNHVPKGKVTVTRIPEFMENESVLAYYYPANSGDKDGARLFVKLSDLDKFPRMDMLAILTHETVPGHHFQMATVAEMKNIQFFRSVMFFNAYIEGWALYAEQLAWEMGVYDDKPLYNLGRLRLDLMRAVRLVVDTGLHYKRWTRQDAIDYMLKTLGTSEEHVISEVEKFIVYPGQACSYKIGKMRIIELREKFKKVMGENYDIKEFHDLILSSGPVPLFVLEQIVDNYMREK